MKLQTVYMTYEEKTDISPQELRHNIQDTYETFPQNAFRKYICHTGIQFF